MSLREGVDKHLGRLILIASKEGGDAQADGTKQHSEVVDGGGQCGIDAAEKTSGLFLAM